MDALSVYKYPLAPDSDQEVAMPDGASILSFAEQHGTFCLWALVDPNSSMANRRIRIAGTGHPINLPVDRLRFIGTTLIQGGSLVFHAFEILP